ncbi:MAG: rhodanese-like domain-containing protein [Sphingobacteriales bacterium]|nr:rhodanese-like domain-containing protein [Sphingobacteriales bacterium]
MMKTIEKPLFQEFHIDGVKHISPADAYELLIAKQAVLIDVREEFEISFENVPIENVLYHPMSVIMERLPYISKNQNIILACPGGVRSSKVANLMNREGYPDVANLDGGYSKWKSLGLPMQINLKPDKTDSSCGCGCVASSPCDTEGGCC